MNNIGMTSGQAMGAVAVIPDQSSAMTTASIMAAARVRWPEWGPWKITISHHEDGRIEYALVGRSPVPSQFEIRARIGKDLETLARRVMDSTSDT
jgi:hypothetical protein